MSVSVCLCVCICINLLSYVWLLMTSHYILSPWNSSGKDELPFPSLAERIFRQIILSEPPKSYIYTHMY